MKKPKGAASENHGPRFVSLRRGFLPKTLTLRKQAPYTTFGYAGMFEALKKLEFPGLVWRYRTRTAAVMNWVGGKQRICSVFPPHAAHRHTSALANFADGQFAYRVQVGICD